MSLEGRAFLKFFRDGVALRVKASSINAGWNSSPQWTELMLGSSASRQSSIQDFGLLGAIGKSLGYWVEAEYLRVDQTWSSVPAHDRADWIIEAFIEHENKIAKIPETIRKVMHLGPGVKIIISYPEGRKDEEITSAVSDQIKAHYGIAPDARLLVILGRLRDSLPMWRGYEFDGLGRCVELQS